MAARVMSGLPPHSRPDS